MSLCSAMVLDSFSLGVMYDRYPGSYAKGAPIAGLAEAEALDNTTVYHAGTSLGK